MSTYDALKLENQLCFPLYAAAKEIVRLYTPYLTPLDLTYTQYVVMMVVWERQEIVVKELGELVYLDTGTLTPLLRKLHEKGYVALEPLKQDRRSVLVRITKRGKELRKRAANIPLQVGACVDLEASEAQMLYRTAYKLLAKIKKTQEPTEQEQTQTQAQGKVLA